MKYLYENEQILNELTTKQSQYEALQLVDKHH